MSFFSIRRYEHSLRESIQVHLSTLKRFRIDLLLNFTIAMTTDVLKTKCLYGVL